MKAEDTDAPTGRLIETIHRAFGATPHPGDAFLQGSFDGCEPFEEVGHFKGKPVRWRRDRAGDEAGAIDAALAGFWLERARSAPPAGDLGPG
jgi:hypothetical protein